MTAARTAGAATVAGTATTAGTATAAGTATVAGTATAAGTAGTATAAGTAGAGGRWASWMSGGGRAAVTRGTVRTCSLEQTWQRLVPLLAGRGITRVADLTGLDVLNVPVWTAIRPAAATLSASAGKGLSHTAARISAVMESLEVAAAEQARVPVVVRDAARALAPGYGVGELSLHPVSLVDERTVLEWTCGWDLAAGAPALVPAAAVGLRGWAGDGWQPATFLTTTNGLASGNDHVEATVHALLEVAERDALARLREGDAIATDLDSVGERLGPVIERIHAAGADVALERIPSLPGTFTYTCWLTQPEMWQIFAGSGCHTDPAIAAERALLEAVQSRACAISGGRDDIPEWTFRPLAAAPTGRLRPAPRHTEPLPTLPTGQDTTPGGATAGKNAAPTGQNASPGHATASQGASPGDATAGRNVIAGDATAGRDATPTGRGAAVTLGGVLEQLVAAVHQATGRPVITTDLTPHEQPWPAVVQVFAPGLGLALEHPRPQTLASRSHP
ncbi:YcaO-like family protein [Streptomyces sp. NPDC005481]|uniref:YcaO-like family protein n=1 Tax=Streptomyces sp. NPDC005481 TaxID=3154881 RepID=UPI0033A49640